MRTCKFNYNCTCNDSYSEEHLGDCCMVPTVPSGNYLETVILEQQDIAPFAAFLFQANAVSGGGAISHSPGSGTIHLLNPGAYLALFTAVPKEGQSASVMFAADGCPIRHTRVSSNGACAPLCLQTLLEVPCRHAASFSVINAAEENLSLLEANLMIVKLQ